MAAWPVWMRQALIGLLVVVVIGVAAVWLLSPGSPPGPRLLLPVQENGLWGVVDTDGDWVIQPEHRSLVIVAADRTGEDADWQVNPRDPYFIYTETGGGDPFASFWSRQRGKQASEPTAAMWVVGETTRSRWQYQRSFPFVGRESIDGREIFDAAGRSHGAYGHDAVALAAEQLIGSPSQYVLLSPDGRTQLTDAEAEARPRPPAIRSEPELRSRLNPWGRPCRIAQDMAGGWRVLDADGRLIVGSGERVLGAFPGATADAPCLLLVERASIPTLVDADGKALARFSAGDYRMDTFGEFILIEDKRERRDNWQGSSKRSWPDNWQGYSQPSRPATIFRVLDRRGRTLVIASGLSAVISPELLAVIHADGRIGYLRSDGSWLREAPQSALAQPVTAAATSPAN